MIIRNSQPSVKHDRLALTSGAKVKQRKFGPPAPPKAILTIGKRISLELTLQAYEITPNAATLAEIGGSHA